MLIHGFLGSHFQWNEIIQAFTKEHRTITIDLPGHGESDNAKKPYTLEDIAHSIHEIINREGVKTAHFIGHSMGGYIASRYAVLYPETVTSLVLINSIAGPDSTTRKKDRDRSISLIHKYKDAYVSMAITNLFTSAEREKYQQVIKTMKSHALNLTQDSIIQAITAMKNRLSVLEELSNHPLPTLYIYSESDLIVPAATINEEALLLKAHTTVVESGHMAILTHPLEVADNIEKFLTTLL